MREPIEVSMSKANVEQLRAHNAFLLFPNNAGTKRLDKNFCLGFWPLAKARI